MVVVESEDVGDDDDEDEDEEGVEEDRCVSINFTFYLVLT